MSLIHLGWVIFALLAAIPSILLIDVILTKSPKKMKFIRPFLLKMAICDSLLLNSLVLGYLPDLYQPQFPLPLIKVNGFYKYLGDYGGYIALVAFVCNNTLSMIAVTESCIIRFAIIYNMKAIVEFANGIRFILFEITEIVMLIAVVVVMSSRAVGGMTELKEFVIRHNANFVLASYDVERDVVMFIPPETSLFWLKVSIIMAPLLTLPLGLCAITYLTHRKIKEESKMMSSETFKLQKRLTAMLFTQILLPVVMIDLPSFGIGITVALVYGSPHMDATYRSLYGNFSWGYAVFVLPIILYPIFNAIATIFIVKPYRRAILELFSSASKRIPCIRQESITAGTPKVAWAHGGTHNSV